MRVRLAVDNAAAGDETVIPAIAAGETPGVTLFARMTQEGYHTVTASIAHDHLPADDQRTLAVHVHSRVSVLLVDGSERASGGSRQRFSCAMRWRRCQVSRQPIILSA